ncbi:hypothetical protein [Kitasatospora sp. NPDC058190]|uniref:hypothetical protein n=1 Tax=Kitasatospora sp. NPDC058190 TaxID=3346371 RepID=UPI0036DD433C
MASTASAADVAIADTARNVRLLLCTGSPPGFVGHRLPRRSHIRPRGRGRRRLAGSGPEPITANAVVAVACRELQSICNDYAKAIDDCQDRLIELGVTAGVATTGGVLPTVFTLGGSDAAAAEALAAAEAEMAAAAAVAEAIVSSLVARFVVLAGTDTATAITGSEAADAATPGTPAGGAQSPAGQSPLANPAVGPALARQQAAPERHDRGMTAYFVSPFHAAPECEEGEAEQDRAGEAEDGL